LNDKGFNVNEIILEFQDLQSLELKLKYLSNRVNELINQKLILEQKNATLEDTLSVRYQRLALSDDLKHMGLGLDNLKLLCNTIREIAAENHIPYREAIEQFFQWVEKQYGGIKLRQNLQDQDPLEHNAKPRNPPTSCFNSEFHYLASMQQSRLEERDQKQEQERHMRSISYEHTKTDSKSKITDEQNNQLNNDDGDSDSDDDIQSG
jgi:hypothetical protein